MERDSTKDVEKVKIEDISLGYLKKMVHTIMSKCYGNAGYRHSDLIRKILRKLKCDYSPKAAGRVRNQLRNWIISNNEIVKFGNADSKKGILSNNSKQGIIKDHKKKKIDVPDNTNKEIENSTNVNNLNVADSTSLNTEKHTDQNDKSMDQDHVSISTSLNTEKHIDQNDKSMDRDPVSISTEKQSDYNKILVFEPENTGLKTQVCNCSCKFKKNPADQVTIKQELINLTIDDENPADQVTIKQELINLTIDDENPADQVTIKQELIDLTIDHENPADQVTIKQELIDLTIDENPADQVTIKQELIDLTSEDDLVKTEDDDEMYDIKYAGTFTMSATTEEPLPNSNEKDFLQSSTMSGITDSSGVVEFASEFVCCKDVHSNKENLRDNKVIKAVSDKSSCSVEQLDSSSCSFKTCEETVIIDIKKDIDRINSDIESEEGQYLEAAKIVPQKEFCDSNINETNLISLDTEEFTTLLDYTAVIFTRKGLNYDNLLQEYSTEINTEKVTSENIVEKTLIDLENPFSDSKDNTINTIFQV